MLASELLSQTCTHRLHLAVVVGVPLSLHMCHCLIHDWISPMGSRKSVFQSQPLVNIKGLLVYGEGRLLDRVGRCLHLSFEHGLTGVL